MDNSHKKGKEFELKIKRIIEDVISKAKAEFRAQVISHQPLMGFSTEWRPDLVLMTSHLLDSLKPSLELAIVECKYIDDLSSEGTYWTEMSRAYMSLNDLRLAYRQHLSFYLAVNRNSKGRTRDYSKIFGNISVKLVNINIPEERSEFESDMKQLLEETTYDEQAKKLEHIFEGNR
jgi:hypothetical protein